MFFFYLTVRKKIDDTITRLVGGAVKEDRKKNQTVSFTVDDGSFSTLPPRANIAAANMTYENLQGMSPSIECTRIRACCFSSRSTNSKQWIFASLQ